MTEVITKYVRELIRKEQDRSQLRTVFLEAAASRECPNFCV